MRSSAQHFGCCFLSIKLGAKKLFASVSNFCSLVTIKFFSLSSNEAFSLLRSVLDERLDKFNLFQVSKFNSQKSYFMEVFYWCPVTNQNVNRISGSIGLDKVLFATNSARKYFSCISLNKAKKISVRMTIITAAWPIASYGTSSWSSSAARNRYPDSVLRISTFDFKYDQDRFTFVCIAAPFRSVSF